MANENSTKEELVAELSNLRKRNAELESLLLTSSSAAGAANPRVSNDQPTTADQTSKVPSNSSLETLPDVAPLCCPADNDTLYRTLVETSRDIIWTVDLNLKYTFLSPSVTEALGYSVDEFMQVDPLQGLTPKSRELLLSAYAEELKKESLGPRGKYSARTAEIERYRKDGTKRWEELTMTFLRGADGRPTGILGVSRDVTERKLLELSLEQAKADLEFKVERRTSELQEINRTLRQEVERSREIEKHLSESQEKYRSLVQNSPVGIMSIDESGRILEVNQVILEIMGSPSAEATKAINILTFPPLVNAGISDAFIRCLEQKRITTTETPYVSKWGRKSYLRTLLTPVFGAHDRVAGCQAVVEDITQRKIAEEKLTRELSINSALAQLYVPLVSSTSSMELVTDKILELALSLTGSEAGYVSLADRYTGDLVVPSCFPESCGPDGKKMVLERSCEGSYSGLCGQSVNQQAALLLSDPRAHPSSVGTPSWHVPIRNLLSTPVILDGRTVGQISLANSGKGYDERDLDTINRLGEYFALAIRKYHLESGLRESEQRFRVLSEGAFEGIVISRNGVILDSNRRFSDMSGYPLEELKGMTIMEITAPEFRHTLSNILLTESEEVYETCVLKKDGSRMIVEVQGKGSPYEGGRVRIGSLRDITERKKADQVRMRLVTAVEQADEAICITNTQGLILYVNPAFQRVSGYSQDEALGNRPSILKSGLHEDSFYRNLWQTLNRGETWSGRFTNRKKDGSLYFEDASISPVRDKTGAIVNYVAVKRDITKELELQRQLFEAQKLEAVGTLAGGIAHDFNNLLQIVIGYCELLLGSADFDSNVLGDLQKIYQAAQNGAELVKRLLTFSRRTEFEPYPLNLNHKIEQLQKIISRIIPKMIGIHLMLDDNLSPINADPIQIEQVLLNLVVNARDAMPDGGTLAIETKNVTLKESSYRDHTEMKEGRYVCLQVSDTGRGIEKNILDHIFEPFYTTKGPGEGSGLGLAMVYGIVKQHGGHITCESAPEEGAKFCIYFPAIDPKDESPQQPHSELLPKGIETILLVDDEEPIRELGERILKKAGYRVLAASDGGEALKLYSEEKDSISLIILDLIMPKMGGKLCLQAILQINPRARVLIASGHSPDESLREILKRGARGFVNKPYDRATLLGSVRKALDET